MSMLHINMLIVCSRIFGYVVAEGCWCIERLTGTFTQVDLSEHGDMGARVALKMPDELLHKEAL